MMLNGIEIECCGVELMEFCKSLSDKKEYTSFIQEKLDYVELFKGWMMNDVLYLLTYFTEDNEIKKISGNGINDLICAMISYSCPDFIIDSVICSIFKEYTEIAHNIMDENINCVYVWDRSKYYNLSVYEGGYVENNDLPFKSIYDDDDEDEIME